uniref:Ig-like domain-containing protein n=1 Tax=Sander lucioperca TaxID=283035 RepID=A0A8C9X2C5_SANLU
LLRFFVVSLLFCIFPVQLGQVHCNAAARFYWYKQTLGQKPRLISTLFKSSSYKFEFCKGVTVNVKGSGLKVAATVHQSASESIQPGGSVTLNCTVHTGTCDGEHSVYWFKKSEESQPGLIYTHGGRNDQCERKPNTQTHTCLYKLPMKSLNLSHAGTYYCAVTHFYCTMHHFLHVLISVKDKIMIVRYILCYQGYQHSENLYYAALSADLSNKSRGQRDPTWSECVYYSVKQ